MSDHEDISAMDDDGEMVEIDWEPLQGAIDAFHEGGLDFSDHQSLLDHWAALLGALLRKVQADQNLEEDELVELAAQSVAFGTDLAFGSDELPEFLPSDEQVEN